MKISNRTNGSGLTSDPFLLLIMPNDFENSVADFIEKNLLFENGENILLAVSGGADSTALLHSLACLKKQNRFNNSFICAHINHRLRGPEADNDEKFVIDHARRLELPVVTEKIDVRSFAKQNKLSIETAARKLRLSALLALAGRESCKIIATAHQADDNTETIVHNILRGTGFRGLAGIRPKRTFEEKIAFVSPLLCFTRTQIIEYLADKNLAFCEDRTNLDCKYKRNFIRHRLLPFIDRQSAVPMVELLSKLSESACLLNNKVQKQVESIRAGVLNADTGCVRVNLKIFNALHPEVRVELIRQGLRTLGSGLQDLTNLQYNRIIDLALSRIGNKEICLPGGFRAINEYENLCFCTPGLRMDSAEDLAGAVEIKIPGTTRFASFECKAELLDSGYFSAESLKRKDEFTEHFDFDKLVGTLKVRRRREGDKFQPIGLPDEKKVGKFLTDAKIGRRIRDKLLIVEDSEKIIWLWPVRISEKVKITPNTKKVLKMNIKSAEAGEKQSQIFVTKKNTEHRTHPSSPFGLRRTSRRTGNTE